jgi:hypothetical protein
MKRSLFSHPFLHLHFSIVGPYGSYSSLSAMKAGLRASNPAKSARPSTQDDSSLNPLQRIYSSFLSSTQQQASSKKKNTKDKSQEFDKIAKQGVLNLYTLLKARYTTIAAKRQLAILFSFISDPQLQPVAEIRGLLGEIDNCTVTKLEVVRPKPSSNNKATSFTRISSRIGGGFSLSDLPAVNIELPPSLDSAYAPAKVLPVMKCTSRILRINVTDPGEGYVSPPEVSVLQRLKQRPCNAVAILSREGTVDSVLTLDPGYGYGGISKDNPPAVKISPPVPGSRSRQRSSTDNDDATTIPQVRRAQAEAELEYEISTVALIEGGSGYVATEPPKITITPPREDPDWYIDADQLTGRPIESPTLQVRVTEMRYPDGSIAYPMNAESMTASTDISFSRLQSDPLELIPPSVRPELNDFGFYTVPVVSKIPAYANSPSPRFRAVDPLFGSIGSVPVTKGALELRTSEYARLALSGAVCTVLVRTALNPLELIKTKQQLATDEELLEYAKGKMKQKQPTESADGNSSNTSQDEKKATKKDKIGAFDLIQSLVELRGVGALFQSADITFLASLIFGSFGFGATELFRRSFTLTFFQDGGGSGSNSEVVLLLAATVATLITSLAASPFELLRVRSMGLLTATSWTQVLANSVAENRAKAEGKIRKTKELKPAASVLDLKNIEPKDLPPLFAGFPPIASRELAFAIPKFLAFDVIAKTFASIANSQADPGSLPIQVGVGTEGLLISAISGALAGIAGAVVSHPADLILTYTSASKKKKEKKDGDNSYDDEDDAEDESPDWRAVVKDLLSREGGIANLFVGLTPRLTFFFLVIGLQFFLYDYAKNLLEVSSDDLSLVLDVFAAVRQGLVDIIE